MTRARPGGDDLSESAPTETPVAARSGDTSVPAAAAPADEDGLAALTTEQRDRNHPRLHAMTAGELAAAMNRADHEVPVAVGRAVPRIGAAAEAIATRVAHGGRIVYVGAGTSGRLGVLDAAECVPTFGTDPDQVQAVIAGGDGAMFAAVEGAEDDVEAGAARIRAAGLGEQDTVVGLSASGRTPYVVGALRAARESGALTVAVACNERGPVLDAADHPVAVVVGPEILAGSTRLKAGTAQKLVLNMLSTITMIRIGKVYGNVMVDLKVTNDKLRARAARIVQAVADCTRDDAVEALRRADYEVKTAVVMLVCEVPAEQARTLITRADGRLENLPGFAP